MHDPSAERFCLHLCLDVTWKWVLFVDLNLMDPTFGNGSAYKGRSEYFYMCDHKWIERKLIVWFFTLCFQVPWLVRHCPAIHLLERLDLPVRLLLENPLCRGLQNSVVCVAPRSVVLFILPLVVVHFAKYCHHHVCLSVSLSVCLSTCISQK